MSEIYYFRKYFSSEFVLDADILKKIDFELNSFLTAQGLSLPIEYRIYKNGDNGSYFTSSIEKVIAEPNSKVNRISAVIIIIGEERLGAKREKTPVFIECRFSREHFRNCKVEIQDYRKGQSDQQLADNLCDLFEHTQREDVYNYFRIPPLLTGSIPPFLTFCIILLWLRRYPEVQGIRLGYISILEFPLYLMAIVVIYALCILIWQSFKLPKYMDKFLPATGVFLWGAEVHDYRRRLLLRQNLIWGILVALVIGIIASVIANRI